MTRLPLVHRLLAQRKLAEAETACRGIFRSQPEDAEAAHLLGLIVYQRGRGEEACRLLHRAIELEPRVGRFHLNLAGVLGAMSHDALALECSRNAVRLEEHSAHGHHNLGVALERAGRLDESLASYRRAIELRPEYAPAHSHLGNVLKQQGRIEESLAAHRLAVSLAPASRDAHLHLAGSLWAHGNQKELIDCYRRAMQVAPASPAIHSSLLFAKYHDPAPSPKDRLAEAIFWDRHHALPLRASIRPHHNDRTPGRRLRVGFVSPDFTDHPCARNVLPIFRAYDRDAFEFFCYSSVRKPDDVTRRLRTLVDGWRDIRAFPDDKAAESIRKDRIDILIDLCGHMGESRLPVFAHRPAPVQVQMTYPGTTGLSTMDYRITDSFADPPGVAEQHHVERLIRLPVALTYDPGELPPVGPPPGLRAGSITFGCLNRPMKITESAMAVWSRILHSVPRSQIVLLSGSVDGRNSRLESMLASSGIRSDQFRLVPRMPRTQFLELFNEVDIALDAFPYNGDATTLDGLWMGVPLITRAGDSCVSRRGVSHLSAVGLADLVAPDAQAYEQIACTLATDLPRLATVRKTLRHRVLASTLGDATAYTRHFEAALQEAWRQWCRGG